MSINLNSIIEEMDRQQATEIDKKALEEAPTFKDTVKEWTGAGAAFGGSLGGITAGSVAAGVIDKNEIALDTLKKLQSKIPKNISPAQLAKMQGDAAKLSKLSPAAVLGLMTLTGIGIGAGIGAVGGAGVGAGLHKMVWGSDKQEEKTASELLDEMYISKNK